jgi:hypothetical protein
MGRAPNFAHLVTTEGMPREPLFNFVASFSHAHLMSIDETSRETSSGLAASELHSLMWTKKKHTWFRNSDGRRASNFVPNSMIQLISPVCNRLDWSLSEIKTDSAGS